MEADFRRVLDQPQMTLTFAYREFIIGVDLHVNVD